ncbi:hypothetical protein FRC17_001927 [Serendipita sp. 399]|nr:hypothetical protein FRC17_001927 [Serendipita sp. 399]
MSDSDDSSSSPNVVSAPRRKQRTQSSKQPVPWPSLISIPTQWSETDKSPHLIVSPNGRDVTFNGHASSLDTRDAAAVRAECPIPAACGIYYYEVKVVDRGNKGQISIGFATKDLQLSKLPGWEPGSWGYHGDDGLSFSGQPRSGAEFGPRFGTGDTIGCGINFLDHNAFYTKNGTWIGTVFSDLPDRDVYPALGLRTSNEHVQANFGGSPFLFDIDAYVAQVKLKAWKDVQNHTLVRSRIDPGGTEYLLQSVERPIRVHSEDGRSRAIREQDESLKGATADMVFDYLISQGYATTAKRFREQLVQRIASHSTAMSTHTVPHPPVDEASMEVDARGKTQQSRFSDMDQRAFIMKAIIQGDIETAISIMQTKYPSSLTYDEGIVYFRLRCRRFVELSLEAYEAKRRVTKEPEALTRGGTGAGHVASEGAFAMDLDDDELSAISSASIAPAAASWALNGSSTTKAKGKQTARRRSSASRRSGSQPRASSRSHGGPGSLISPATAGASSDEFIEYMQKVLEYGKQLQDDWDQDQRQSVKDQLWRTLGLVAYEDPYTDPRIQDLVSQEARIQLAEEVNRAILATNTGFAIPLIERMYRHTGTCMEALVAVDFGAGAFLDVSRVLTSSKRPPPLKRLVEPDDVTLQILSRTSLSNSYNPNNQRLEDRGLTNAADSRPGHQVRYTDSIRLTVRAFSDVFHLHLRPNDDLIHPAARITHYKLEHGTHGRPIVDKVVPLLRESFMVFGGEVIDEEFTSAKMDEDAAGGIRRPYHSPYANGHRGWARITLLDGGDAEAQRPPVFEGAFSVDGIVHHVLTLDNYLRMKLPEDPEPILGSQLVIFRDSDLMSHEEAEYFRTGFPAQNAGQHKRPQTCAHDRLGFNVDKTHPVLRFGAGFDRIAPSGWYDPFGLVSPDESSAYNASLRKRQNDIGNGSGGSTSNFVDSIGSTLGCPTTQQVVYLGIASDCTYTSANGGNTNATQNILRTFNTVSLLYKSTFNISLGIVELQISDPT